MKLNINDEFGDLESVAVCWGYNMPQYGTYTTNDPEYVKFHPNSWDNNLLLKQQEKFFKRLEKYKVELIFPKLKKNLTQQMFTRDTAFVIGDKFYYSNTRKFKVRNGEVECLLEILKLRPEQCIAVDEEIEGGDVLVQSNNSVLIGHSSRTSKKAIEYIKKYINIRAFELGNHIMHLDTRLTHLPKNIVLTYSSAFSLKERGYISKKYNVIEVNDKEVKELGTNVFVVNPETVFVPAQHKRIRDELINKGLCVESIEYSEPINLSGSFRCTTLPLRRKNI